MARVPGPDNVVGAARELGYIAVGFGVLGFQRAQVRRRELERSLRPVTRLVESIARSLPCGERDQAK